MIESERVIVRSSDRNEERFGSLLSGVINEYEANGFPPTVVSHTLVAANEEAKTMSSREVETDSDALPQR